MELDIGMRDLWMASVRVEASVATMMGVSEVGDVALVEVVGSSRTCPWDCLGCLSQ